ncbi:unnamed protein product, partial [Polarella glacialis]
DGSRMEFKASVRGAASGGARGVACCIQPGDGEEFRLLSAEGVNLRRSFGTPLGVERYAAVARAMMAQLARDPEEESRAAEICAGLAEAEERRTALLLCSHGFSGALDSKSFDKASMVAAPSSAAGLALQRCRDACSAIEGALRGDRQGSLDDLGRGSVA